MRAEYALRRFERKRIGQPHGARAPGGGAADQLPEANGCGMVCVMKLPPGNNDNVTVYKPGMIMMREGARALNACIILTGKVQVFKTVDGQEVVLAEVGPGGVVGEMALIDDAPRMASVRVLEPTTVWVVPKSTFKRLLAGAPSLMRYILHNFLRNIRDTSNRVVKATTKPAGKAEAP